MSEIGIYQDPVQITLAQPGIPSDFVRNTAILSSFSTRLEWPWRMFRFGQGPLLLLGVEGCGEARVCHNAKDLCPTADNHDIEIYPMVV
jgi:hypothetical protein